MRVLDDGGIVDVWRYEILPLLAEHHYGDGGIADVRRYEILPLLAEHHYGDGGDLEARYGLAALCRQAAPSVADGAEGVDTAG